MNLCLYINRSNAWKRVSSMFKIHRITQCSFFLVFIALSSCETMQYDYSALEASKPRSILVIPPMNDSIEVNAPYTWLSTISMPLAEKGYYVFPVAVVDTFMKENGLPTPAEMNSVPLSKIREVIGPDAVLYAHIREWGQKYTVISSNTIVRADLKLVDARTGQMLWNTTVHAAQGSDDGGGGLLGALVSALVTQVVASQVDKTQQLSSMGNYQSIHANGTGLLPGPYLAPEEK